MLIAFALLTLGLALLCYAALTRPRAAAKESLSTTADTVRPAARASQAAQGTVSFLDFSADPNEVEPSNSRVVVSYEDEAEEEDATSPHVRILVTAKGDTDQGHKRRANDDALLMLPSRSLFAVADGMGGYAGGSVASRLAVDTLKQSFEEENFVGELSAETTIPRRGRELASSILQSHQAVFSAARAAPQYSHMGTTLVAARFSPNKQRVYIGNVGDSRCYRFRSGSLRQLTTDQTMGAIGFRGPRELDLSQAIGVSSNLSIDLIVDVPRADDIYLLCSDGLTKMASDQEIQSILAGRADLECAVYELIELANDRGGKDNVTVVLVQVVERAINQVPTVPSPGRKNAGWTKLPSLDLPPDCGSDDVTVVGALPVDDATIAMLSQRAAKTRR